MRNLAKAPAFCRYIKEKQEQCDRCYKVITDLERVLSLQYENQLNKCTHFDIANS